LLISYYETNERGITLQNTFMVILLITGTIMVKGTIRLWFLRGGVWFIHHLD